ARWIPDERADVEGQALENVVAEERRELERAVKLLPSHTAAAIGLVTGYRSFETASLGDVLRAHGEGVQSVARTQVRKAFQRGQADARKLGFEPGDATGPARDSGKLPTPTAFARTNAKQRRDRAADIWRSLASRWGPAAGLD